jgi:hypothetical protein
LNSSVIKDVLPYQKVAGSPARLIGKNTGAGGEKADWDSGALNAFDVDHWHRLLRQREEEQDRMKELKK